MHQRKTSRLAAAGALAVSLAASGVAAATWIVDPGGGGDFTSVQPAIEAAAPGDEILIHDGTYVENLDFLGKDLWVHSSGGPSAVVIDGSDGPHGDASCVKFIWGESAAAVLEGVTLAGGCGTLYEEMTQGGGAFCMNSSPTFRDCLFEGNQADRAGGLWAEGGTPAIIDCVFRGNVVRQSGGAYNGRAQPSFQGCLFEYNKAGATSSNGGGALSMNWGGSVLECTFSSNYCFQGGAIQVDRGAGIVIRDCRFSGNTALDGDGGAVHIREGHADMERCLFTQNLAVRCGGGVCMTAGTHSVIDHCTFHRNDALDGGNLAILEHSATEILNCISAAATRGGGIAAVTDPLTFLCNDAWQNTGGNYVHMPDPTGTDGNITANPLFCDPAAEDWSIRSDSHCAPGFNPGCGLIGAYDVGCDPPSPVVPTTWGGVKGLFR